MTNIKIRCPCCDNEMEIQVNDNGNPIVFLLPKNNISRTELVANYGIDLGIDEGEVE